MVRTFKTGGTAVLVFLATLPALAGPALVGGQSAHAPGSARDEAAMQEAIISACYQGRELAPHSHALREVPKAATARFVDSGALGGFCDLVLGDEIGPSLSASKDSPIAGLPPAMIYGPDGSSLPRTLIGGLVDIAAGVAEKTRGTYSDFLQGLRDGTAGKPLPGEHRSQALPRDLEDALFVYGGPLLAQASGSVLDGDFILEGWRLSRQAAVRNAVQSSQFAECMYAQRLEETRNTQAPLEPIADFYPRYVTTRPTLEAAHRRVRDYVVAMRRYLFDIIRNVAKNPTEVESMRLWLDGIAYGRGVFLEAPDVGQCDVAGEYMTWTATHRVSDSLARLTGYDLARRSRTCDRSPLVRGQASLPDPDPALVRAAEEVLLNEHEKNEANGELSESARALLAEASRSQDDAATKEPASYLGPDRFVGLLIARFDAWVVGRYGAGRGGRPYDDGVALSPEAAKLFADDWKLPIEPCAPALQPYLSPCREPGGETTAGPLPRPARLVMEAYERTIAAAQYHAALTLALATEEVAAGGFRGRYTVSSVCDMRVSNLDARALRGYRDLSSVMTVNETAAAAIRVEQVMAGASLFNISLAKAEQDRLFSYAVKMRRQLSREDAKRSQDSLRDEERRRREEQERKGGG